MQYRGMTLSNYCFCFRKRYVWEESGSVDICCGQFTRGKQKIDQNYFETFNKVRSNQRGFVQERHKCLFWGPFRGGTYVPSLNFKTLRFTYWGGSHVPVGILLLYLRLSLSLLQFQSIFVPFVAISAVLCRCFKAMSLVGLYRNRASFLHLKPLLHHIDCLSCKKCNSRIFFLFWPGGLNLKN